MADGSVSRLVADAARIMPGGLTGAIDAMRVLTEAGFARPVRPDHLLGMGLAAARWGVTPAAGYAAGAVRYPHDVAVLDDEGSVTFAELDRRTNAIANALGGHGVHAGDVVGLLARNGRAFVEATVALSKLGADVLYLNTGFAGPQIAEVLHTESAAAVIYDAEFLPLMNDAARGRYSVLAAVSGPSPPHLATLDRLAAGDDSPPFPPTTRGRHVILTSGTTGRPRGAPRSEPGIEALVAVLDRIPLRVRESTVIAAPTFHAWGFGQLGLAMALSSTVVLHRHFDPERTLAAVAEHEATALVAVPIMLRRMLDLPRGVRDRYDTGSLRVVAVSGSALPGSLATRFMDAFGDVLYNLYGTTEVAYVSIATPADLRAAPETAGRPARNTEIRVVNGAGREVRPGESGRIFVGNGMLFGGYTDGEDRERLDGLMATGDVGHFDRDGRLVVAGRDDEMIVSGGENVFPAEVEDVLMAHPDVADAAVVGVPDEVYGARLVAHVVRRPGSQVEADTLRGHVRSALARFKVPREVRFLAELPRNATGKVLRRQLGGPPAGPAGSGPGGPGPAARG